MAGFWGYPMPMRLPTKVHIRPQDFQAQVTTRVDENDLAMLALHRGDGDNPKPTLRKLNARHYNTARLIADGFTDQEIAYRTGRSTSHVNLLRSDAMMQGLVNFFLTQRVDVEIEESKRFRSRLLNIGDGILESIEEQVESDPTVMSFAERRAWVQMVADRTVAPPKQAGSAIIPPQQITFQIAGTKIINQAAPKADGKVIEGTVTEVVAEVEKS
jgi:hypothetical protein